MNTYTRPERLQFGGVLFKLLLWLVVLIALAATAWFLLLPRIIVSQIHSKTGFAVKVDHLSVNPLTANVEVKGMVLKNPDGWPVEDFVHLREFKAGANLASVFSDRIVADEVVIDVARFTLVKNQQGVYNATVFSDALAGKGASGKTEPQGPKKQFLIKHLVLKFDTLVYADHSLSKPTSKEYNLNLNQDLTDVDSVAKIIKPITTASIGVLTDAFSGVLNGRTDLVKDVTGAIKDAGKKTGEKLKGLMDALDKKKP